MKNNWIKRLPPGEYTIRQIEEFAGLKPGSGNAIKKKILKHGATLKLVTVGKTILFKQIFVWKGFPTKDKQDKDMFDNIE